MRAGAALCAIVLLSTACGGAETRLASHMERGERYLADGKLEKARVEFRNALQIAPNDAQARYMNGRVAEKLGDLRGAVGLYQGAIDVSPDHVQARAELSRVLVFAGAPDRALETIQPGLAKHPDDAGLLTVRGAARAQKKDRAGALADATRAVKIAPQNENAVALLASLYRQAGETPRAVDLIERTIKASPRTVDLREVLANLYLASNEPRRAEEQLRKVIELEPKKLNLRTQLAIFYLRTKRPDDAQHVLEAALRDLPESDEAKLAYVEFLTAQRSRAQGEQAMKGFIAKAPKDYDLQLGLAGLQQGAASKDEAIATYRKIIAADGDGAKGLIARNRIAALRVAEGKIDEAAQLAAEVLKKNPRDNDALILRGNIALERHDTATAIADLRAVLRDQPNAVGVRRTLARAHLANGEPELAEESLRTALDAAPADGATRLELAQLLGQTGRVEQAATLLEDSVKAAPQDPAAREALVRVYIAKQDFVAARIAAEDLKTLRPDLAAGSYLAGLIAQAQNRLDDSEKELQRAVELQPNAMDALAALTRLEIQRGRRDAAVARVKAVVSRDGNNPVAHNLLGELYLAVKDSANASEQLARAQQLAPKWWLPYRNLALVKLGANDVPGGIATYEAGVKATNLEPVLVSDLAAIYERQGRIDEAIRQYEALHKHNPQLQLAANNLAMLLVTYKKDRPSLDRARDLTSAFANSTNGALLDTHGWVRFKRGDYSEALPVLEQAVQRTPGSSVIRYHLAMAQLQAGRRSEARTNLETALTGAKNFAGSDEARSKLAELKNTRAS